MKEILLAVLGVLGVAIPSVIQLMTGESRRVSNMRATIDLIAALPDDDDLVETKSSLRKSLRREAKVDQSSSSHVAFLVWGCVIIALCLVCSFFVMQTPGTGQTRASLHSVLILVDVVLYVLGAASVAHAAHLFGRSMHIFAKTEPPSDDPAGH